jgi:hypothetical protein
MRTVSLEPYEYERARLLGLERALRFQQNGHRPDYAVAWSQRADLLDDVETANVNGALVELAAAKMLGIYWHGHGGALDRNKRYRHTPDVADWLECRHVLRPDAGPKITQKDVEEAEVLARRGITLYVLAGHVRGAQVDIYGMTPVLEAWRHPCPDCRRHDDGLRICQNHLTLPGEE